MTNAKELFDAASDGKLDRVKSILKRFPKLLNDDLEELDGMTALHTAAQLGQTDVVKYLLSLPEIDVNIKSSSQSTALMYASYEGHEAIVQLLLSRGDIDVNAVDKSGETALHGSTQLDITKLLLSHPKIQINLRNGVGYTALFNVSCGDDLELFKYLLFYPGIDTSASEDGDTLIHAASYCTHPEHLKLIFDTQPQIDVNAQNKSGETALHWIAQRNYLHTWSEHKLVAKEILSHPRIQPHLRNKAGLSCIDIACNGMNEYIYDTVFNSEAFQKTLDMKDVKIWCALSVFRSCYTNQPEEKKADHILRYFFDQGNTRYATSLFLLRHEIWQCYPTLKINPHYRARLGQVLFAESKDVFTALFLRLSHELPVDVINCVFQYLFDTRCYDSDQKLVYAKILSEQDLLSYLATEIEHGLVK